MAWRTRHWVLGCVILALMGGLRARGDEPKTKPAPATAPKAKEDAEVKRRREDAELYELYKTFADTLYQVEQNYVTDIDRRELMEAAIRGVLDKLDPYSNYISPDEIDRFKTTVESQFGGIGIQITMEDGKLRVLSPVVGSPAYRAGILAGDWIAEIEGKSTENLKRTDEAVKLLKGEAGTSVTLTIVHPNASKRETVTITRELIHVDTVLGDTRGDDDRWNFMLDPAKKIGYIRITAFSRDTAEDVETALKTLKKAGFKALVLDLRFNPGGLLKAATDVADLFVTEGVIVSTKGRNSAERKVTAREPGTYTGFPIAVLVNRYSASASEIVAACLQDHRKAVIVGERTFGKGSVQNVIDLEGGKSALKLTTASYWRPNGHNIHRFPDAKDSDEWGVMPDQGYEIKLSPAEMSDLDRVRRERDVLVVSHATGKPISGEFKPAPAAAPKTDQDKPDESKPQEDKPSFVDRQLQKALDYLDGAMAKAD